MRRRFWIGTAAVACLLVVGAVAVGADRLGFHVPYVSRWLAGTTFAADDLSGVTLEEPKNGKVEGIVILVSDRGGIQPADRTLADGLLASGLATMTVDLDRWRAELDKRSDDCLYFDSAFEELAKDASRAMGLSDYFHPVIVGRGEGGVLAYSAVADAPDATVAGGVALDPAEALVTKIGGCPGAAVDPAPDGVGYVYGPQFDVVNDPMPAPFVFVSPTGQRSAMANSLEGQPKITLAEAPTVNARRETVIASALRIARTDAATASAPIIDLKPKTPAKALVVFFSGDGGWRDIDESIGTWLSHNGVHVVGVDSLRYFWAERTPDDMARDIQSIIERADPGGRLPVSLLGYSFGADTLPFAIPRLPQALQDRVSLIGLLSPEKKTGFEITVEGWFGSVAGDRDVVEAVRALPAEKVACLYGADDADDSACPMLAGDNAITIVKTEGGHHFDGDYESLARRLLQWATAGGPPRRTTSAAVLRPPLLTVAAPAPPA
ncbi:Type IV secretory pathway, VirJ component [Hartmannibacter diazotrophicus]|uniref:Type IV secretory pathway, VirJ component n=1 Tax=Hartmannibacter diazotrophicus TaxID=1482074 RepID=A0A2C9CZZ1_9HYPH|nr:AcvB/VirJ family lysyl-phosphatidylglycerol hydrolase [Hartmannibacter diazotrophicus]SON53566.1 Type IV secretory pathway, VirJ component [Hartmannibacter diazotrophicus]